MRCRACNRKTQQRYWITGDWVSFAGELENEFTSYGPNPICSRCAKSMRWGGLYVAEEFHPNHVKA